MTTACLAQVKVIYIQIKYRHIQQVVGLVFLGDQVLHRIYPHLLSSVDLLLNHGGQPCPDGATGAAADTNSGWQYGGIG